MTLPSNWARNRPQIQGPTLTDVELILTTAGQIWSGIDQSGSKFRRIWAGLGVGPISTKLWPHGTAERDSPWKTHLEQRGVVCGRCTRCCAKAPLSPVPPFVQPVAPPASAPRPAAPLAQVQPEKAPGGGPFLGRPLRGGVTSGRRPRWRCPHCGGGVGGFRLGVLGVHVGGALRLGVCRPCGRRLASGRPRRPVRRFSADGGRPWPPSSRCCVSLRLGYAIVAWLLPFVS